MLLFYFQNIFCVTCSCKQKDVCLHYLERTVTLMVIVGLLRRGQGTVNWSNFFRARACGAIGWSGSECGSEAMGFDSHSGKSKVRLILLSYLSI